MTSAELFGKMDDFTKSLFDFSIEQDLIRWSFRTQSEEYKESYDFAILDLYVGRLFEEMNEKIGAREWTEEEQNTFDGAFEVREAIKSVLYAPPIQSESTVITLDVPSGKLVVNDSLSEFIKLPRSRKGTKNSLEYGFGLHNMAKDCEAQGIAYIFSQGISPKLLQQTDGSILVSSLAYNEALGEDVFENGEKEIAVVYTDLWAVTMVDYDYWISHGGIPEGVQRGRWEKQYQYIEVPAGKYEITIHTTREYFEFNYDNLFERIELLNLEDPEILPRIDLAKIKIIESY